MSSSSSRNIIVYVQCKVLVISYNVQTQQRTDHGNLPNIDMQLCTSAELFAKLQSIFNFKQIKAIAFSFIGPEFLSLKKHFEFLEECRGICNKNGIFCYFPSMMHFQSSLAISQTKTMVKEGEKVTLFFLDSLQHPPCGYTLIRKKDCYEIDMNGPSDCTPFIKRLEENVVEAIKPRKVILFQGFGSTNDTEKAKLIFKNYNPIIVPLLNIAVADMETIVDILLHQMDENINPYHITVPSFCAFDVRIGGKSLITAAEFEVLPFEKSIVIPVNRRKRVSLFCDNVVFKTPQMVEEIKLSTFKCKKAKVTLKIDDDSLYDLKVEPYDGKESKLVDEPIDQKPLVPEKARLIFDKQNFSVYVFDEKQNECVLKDVDGFEKTPIYIAFHQEKPVIGKAAKDIYAEKPKCVVFDLIKLCSITNTDIESPKWGFSLSQENESIYVTMNTVDEEKKSTVEFLLALILKNGKDRIKKEYGKKMKDIEIGFNGFVPNEILKNNFIEAGKLLDVNITFV